MALLEQKLAPPPSEPASDRAPDRSPAGVAQPLRGELEALLGADRVLGRASDIVRYASDASPYRLFPQAVVMAHDADDVAKVLAYGRRSGIPVTFRAGGTSLNGQGQSDGILVDVRRHFGGVAVEDGGALARVKPGTVLGHANRVLAPHGRKLGPDPASTDIACVGGVIANNSGGMRCGVTKDSYSTVRSMTLVLASGTTIDTAAPDAAERFAAAEPELAAGLAAIRDEIRADAELSERIRRKFAIKNTTGYRLCAFLDADEPLEIFRRLVVGSEGTLAFVAEAVFETVPLPARTTTAWIHFPGIDEAIAPVRDLVDSGATAVELMVAPALITAAWNMVGAPEEWKELPPESAVLLVEYGAASDEELDAYVAKAERDLRRPRDDPADRVHPRGRGDRARLARARGPARPDRPPAPARHGADRRGRLRAAGADRRGRPRPAGAARRARLPARRRRPRLGRQPALHADPGLRQAGGPRALRGLHGEAGRADRRQVRRLAQGRARDRDQHGALCRARVGREGDRADVAGEAARRPRRRAQPRRRPQPRPRRPPAQPQNHAADRGVGDHLRRVRLLRAGLPEPQPDHDAAPADRPAPRDGAPAGGLAGAAGAARGVRVRLAGDLRRRRLLPARLPGRDRHRHAGQGTAQAEAHARAPKRAALATAKRWGGVEKASRAGLRVGGPLARRTKRGKGLPGAGIRRRCRATAREGAAAVYVPSCTNRIFGPHPRRRA